MIDGLSRSGAADELRFTDWSNTQLYEGDVNAFADDTVFPRHPGFDGM